MKTLKAHVASITITFVVIVLGIIFLVYYHSRRASSCAEAVSFIPIIGDITPAQDLVANETTTPEADEDTILAELQSANNDPNVKAIVLVIDSPGGDPETAEEITQEMARIHKPKLALIRSQGTSAAYWIASTADKIYAFQTSQLGDIGITDSYLSDAQQNVQNGLQFIPLTSGPFKDTGNPNKPVTQADRALLMQGVEEEYNIFVSAVANNRGMTIAQVKALADGSERARCRRS